MLITIDEAIKELESELKCDFRLITPSLRRAMALGIEALNRVRDIDFLLLEYKECSELHGISFSVFLQEKLNQGEKE